MLPEPNAPGECQAWVRDVSKRTDVVSRHASRTEGNAYALAGNAKTTYELLGNRIENIGTFTTGLFEQDMVEHSMETYATLDALPVLYEYAAGDFQVKTAVVDRISFAKYNSLTVTTDGFLRSFTTDVTATGIPVDRPLLPMVQATIPSLGIMLSNGTYVPDQLTYASRWTVENFEPFAGYNIPGNVVPAAYSSTYGQGPPGYHPDSGLTQIRHSRDGYTGYSMTYTREWLIEYMNAITQYSNDNVALPSGARFYPPDVNLIDIVLGYYYQPYTSVTSTNLLYINDARLSINAGATFVTEGIRNMGY